MKLLPLFKLGAVLSAFAGCNATHETSVATKTGAHDSAIMPTSSLMPSGHDFGDATAICGFDEGGTALHDAALTQASTQDAGTMLTHSAIADASSFQDAPSLQAAMAARDASRDSTRSDAFDAAPSEIPDASEVDAARESGALNAADAANDAPPIGVLNACEDDGVSDVDAQGVCSVNWSVSAGVGISANLGDSSCEGLWMDDGLELQLRVDAIDLVPDPVIPGHVMALYPSTVLSHEPECTVLMEWNSLAAVPALVVGQFVSYSQHQIELQDDAAGFTQLRDEAGSVLFAQYSGPPTEHAAWGVPDLSMTWLPEICRAPFSDTSNPVMLHPVRLEVGDEACRLDAGSWTCCQLWQQPYRTYLQATSMPGRDGLYYAISRADFFVSPF